LWSERRRPSTLRRCGFRQGVEVGPPGARQEEESEWPCAERRQIFAAASVTSDVWAASFRFEVGLCAEDPQRCSRASGSGTESNLWYRLVGSSSGLTRGHQSWGGRSKQPSRPLFQMQNPLEEVQRVRILSGYISLVLHPRGANVKGICCTLTRPVTGGGKTKLPLEKDLRSTPPQHWKTSR
jgi:hypothetical protein